MRKLRTFLLLVALVLVTSAQTECPIPAPATNVRTDSIAPNPPSQVWLQPVSSTAMQLSWGYDDYVRGEGGEFVPYFIDDVGVTRFYVYRGGRMVKTAFALNMIDSLLTPGTEYTYYIRAADAAGNISRPSAEVTFATPSGN